MPDQTARHSLDLPIGAELVTRALYRALITEIDTAIPTSAELRAVGLAQTLAATTPTALPDGITFDAVVTGDGWPADGTLLTIKADADNVIQILQEIDGDLQIRHAASTTTWTAWKTNFASTNVAQTWTAAQTLTAALNARTITEEKVTDATFTGADTIDCALGEVHALTLTGNVTAITFSNVPATGKAFALTLLLKQDGTGSRTVTWPASVKWPGGTAPTLTTTAGRTDVVTLITHDGGTTWLGFLGGKDFNA